MLDFLSLLFPCKCEYFDEIDRKYIGFDFQFLAPVYAGLFECVWCRKTKVEEYHDFEEGEKMLKENVQSFLKEKIKREGLLERIIPESGCEGNP